MLHFILKLLVTLWPFLKNIIFKDRTIREVLKTNKQFTLLFGLLVMVTISLLMTVQSLTEIRSQHLLAINEIRKLRSTKPPINELLSDCEPCICDDPYNKQRIIDLLGDKSP